MALGPKTVEFKWLQESTLAMHFRARVGESGPRWWLKKATGGRKFGKGARDPTLHMVHAFHV